MRGPRPSLISGETAVAEAIHGFIEPLGRPPHRSTFGNCRRHIAWHEPGLLLLLAAGADDVAPVVALVRERALRQSPLTMVIVRGPGLSDGGAIDQVAPLAADTIAWPADAAKLRTDTTVTSPAGWDSK